MKHHSFITYQQYSQEFSVPDILDELEKQQHTVSDESWGHYIDPGTLDTTQKSRLKLKKFWSDQNLSGENLILHKEEEGVDDPEFIFYNRVLMCVTLVIVCLVII